MFKQQSQISAQWVDIETLLARYSLDNTHLLTLRPSVQNFKMRVPLVGAFSAGKSTLLNALLGEKLLSLEVTPETGVPTELHYNAQESFTGHLKPQGQRSLNRADLSHFGQQTDAAWIEAHVSAAVLAKIPHVCLVDLPGLDSGLKAHSSAIDSYIGRSLAYCVVVSVDEGDIHQTTQNFLAELSLHQMPVILILTKSDKKHPDDLPSLIQKMTASVTQVLKCSPMAVVTVSARKKATLPPLLAALDQLEQRAEQRFTEVVTTPVVHILQGLQRHLDTLINQDDLNAEQLKVKQEQLEKEMAHFNQQLAQQTQALSVQIDPIVARIMQRVESRLAGQVDSLAQSLINKADIGGTISQTVRMAVTEGIQMDFMPKVNKYIQRVESELPDTIRVDAHFDTDIDSAGVDTAAIGSLATGVVAALAAFFPPLAALIPFVKPIIEFFMGKKDDRQEQLEAQREQARSHVLGAVIPKILQQVSGNLVNHLQNQLDVVQQQIQAAADVQNQQQQAALNAVQATLKQGQAAFEAARLGYQKDQKDVLAMIQQLS